MFSKADIRQIEERGSSLNQITKQVEDFRKGFPFLPIMEAASVKNGIISLSEEEKSKYISFFEKKVGLGTRLLKFVPASGAASRMFKALFEAKGKLEKGVPEKEVIEEIKVCGQFVSKIEDFAFSGDLKEAINQAGQGKNAFSLLHFLLSAEGLNYGTLPKGLLKFHSYGHEARTPFEEHLMEGVLYAKDNAHKVNLHFTVSTEHQEGFEKLFNNIKDEWEKKHNVKFKVSFSQQKPSTDTIAVDENNEPFRNEDNSLLFRPGGHGALLENLNDLDADVVFIKNIDNVVPDKYKAATTEYKKALAGILLKYQEHIFRYQKELNEKLHTALDSAFLAEAANFMQNSLNTIPPENQYYTEKETLYYYLRQKYNRPLRVCGMVKNEGEPGGGPFWAQNSDGTVSLQVVESSQIDMKSPQQQKIANYATHFNPVDLVCGVKNYKGEKYNLLEFRDTDTGFISIKFKDGKPLKAMELPGLWNGAMSDWNTLFVEVPIDTFNPVKTVNDLLRDKHQ